MKRYVLLSAISTLLALLPLPLAHADQAAGKALAPDVLFAVYPAQPAAEEFLPVVVDAIRYKLTVRGLAAAVADGAKDSGQLTAQARKAATPIVLSCGISASDSQLAISLEWRDLQKPSTPVRVEGAGPLDLTLDSVILKSLDSLIGSIAPRIDQLVAARAAAMRAAAAAAQQGPATAAGPAQGAATAPAAAVETPSQPVSPPAAPFVIEQPYFAMDVGAAPFVPVAAASAYFPVGGLLSADARWVVPTSAGRISLGLSLAAIYFVADGTITTAQDFLIPLGADIRYDVGNGAPFLLFAHVSAGPALLVMATASQGMLIDLTAYLRTGLGASYMFTPRLGLSIIVDYEIYFEMPYLIMGLTPQVALSFKL